MQKPLAAQYPFVYPREAPMTDYEFARYRAGIDRLVDLAHEQLDEGQRRRLRMAVELRHGNWETIARDTAVENLDVRFVWQLAEADRELGAEQVSQLEALVYERLPDPT